MLFDGLANGDDFSPAQAFSRGFGSVLSSKYDEKAFKFGGGKSFQEEGRFYKYASSAILKGTNNVAVKYGQYGETYTEKYGAGIWGNVFLGGAASGLVTQGLAHGLSAIGNNHLMTGISTLDGDIIGNITKNGIPHLNKGYSKKNKSPWFKANWGSTSVAGGSFGLGSFFNFFGR
jgi:hypothetical protein